MHLPSDNRKLCKNRLSNCHNCHSLFSLSIFFLCSPSLVKISHLTAINKKFTA